MLTEDVFQALKASKSSLALVYIRLPIALDFSVHLTGLLSRQETSIPFAKARDSWHVSESTRKVHFEAVLLHLLKEFLYQMHGRKLVACRLLLPLALLSDVLQGLVELRGAGEALEKRRLLAMDQNIVGQLEEGAVALPEL